MLLALALVESQAEPAVTCTVKVTPAVPEALVTLSGLGRRAGTRCVVKVSEVGDTVTFPVFRRRWCSPPASPPRFESSRWR